MALSVHIIPLMAAKMVGLCHSYVFFYAIAGAKAFQRAFTGMRLVLLSHLAAKATISRAPAANGQQRYGYNPLKTALTLTCNMRACHAGAT